MVRARTPCQSYDRNQDSRLPTTIWNDGSDGQEPVRTDARARHLPRSPRAHARRNRAAILAGAKEACGALGHDAPEVAAMMGVLCMSGIAAREPATFHRCVDVLCDGLRPVRAGTPEGRP